MTFLVAGIIYIVNLPFGFWRAFTRKFSWQWILAIHVPVIIAISLRLWLGVPFQWTTLPVFVAAYFLGQLSRTKLKVALIKPN